MPVEDLSNSAKVIELPVPCQNSFYVSVAELGVRHDAMWKTARVGYRLKPFRLTDRVGSQPAALHVNRFDDLEIARIGDIVI